MLKIRSRTLAASCAALLMSSMLANAQAAAPRTFEITPQNLSSALTEFARQSGTEILFAPDLVSDKSSPGVRGKLDPMNALKKLLEDSGLTFIATPQGAILLQPAMQPAMKMQTIALMQEAASSTEENPSNPISQPSDSNEARQVVRLEEVVVTGSHIRGVQNVFSPVIGLNRQDIEASGYATTQELMRSLPQNFSNISDTTSGTLNGAPSGTFYGGSGVNLRGLGSESTLVLLNGRRLSPAGAGNFVDVSLIPLSAVERVDVLTDGASAIYGSDAVGGVVNFVLREDFEGAETRVRYGTVTQGNHDELQAGQLLGHAWASGQAMLSYEYYRRTQLQGTDRDFIRPSGRLGSLLAIPGLNRHGALAVLTQELSESVELNAEAVFSQRNSGYTYDLGLPFDVKSELKQFGGSLGMNVEVGRSWQARLSGQFDRNDSNADTRGQLDGVLYANNRNESRYWSMDLAADGPLGRAPGGEVRLAIGSQFRSEQFVEGNTGYPARLEREAAAAYAEVRIPWVSADNRRDGLERLDFTLAGRFEDYSDFGNAFNPKIGLAWAPVRGLNVRGTWGTSFRAPLLSQTNLADNTAYVYPAMFMSGSGATVAGARLIGSGVNLQPEESTNWTVGVDLETASANLSLTYFDVDYRQRIRSPFPPAYDVFSALLDPTYAAVVTGDPALADVAALMSGFPRIGCFTADGGFIWPCTAPPLEDIGVIVDERLRNLAAVRMSGLDFSFSYRLQHALGEFGMGLGGQYLLKNREQFVPAAPASDQLNDVWRPVDFRLRSSFSFTRGAFNAVAFLNYTDDYRDRRTDMGPQQRSTVGSWTTVDLTFQYRIGKPMTRSGTRIGLPETTLSVNAINVFDRDPPFVGHMYGLHFDGVNANPLGRFVAAQLTVRW